jgi:hypothetical protein
VRRSIDALDVALATLALSSTSLKVNIKYISSKNICKAQQIKIIFSTTSKKFIFSATLKNVYTAIKIYLTLHFKIYI